MIVPQFRLQDILDILIMSILIYQLYSWFRNSRAMQVLAGLGTVTAIYFITRLTGLHMTSWVLQQLGTVVIIVIVVVFQHEIRQALYRFSKLRDIMGGKTEHATVPTAIAEAVFGLAAERCGAIIVFQRTDQLDDHLSNGTPLDALVSVPLMRSIFQGNSPLHDGAILVRDERVIQAACLLPLSDSRQLPQQYGTRHRAAVGLTERTDAVVLVVSEERGEISLAEAGTLIPLHTVTQLHGKLEALLAPKDQQRQPLTKRFFSNLPQKAAIVLGVTLIWLLLSSRQGEVAIIPVPVSFHGLPNGMTLTRVSPEEVTVRLRSSSGLAPSPRQLDLTADIDLSGVQEGHNTLRISLSHVRVPPGMTVVGIEPTSVRVVVRSARGIK